MTPLILGEFLEITSLGIGDGGDVERGEIETAYGELEVDIDGEALADDTDAKGEEERNA